RARHETYLEGSRARRYPLREPSLVAVSLGLGTVVTATQSILRPVESLFRGVDRDQVFEAPRLAAVDALLRPHGFQVYGPYPRLVCGADTWRERAAPAGCRIAIEVRPSEQRLDELGPARWPHAISTGRGARAIATVAAAVAYRGDEVVGVATCGDDTDQLWQIGIDVADGFRGSGIGAALTSALARHILEAGRVPWYGAAPANLPSINTALAAGFRLAWVEVFTHMAGRW
ncbi:MAG: GNAT family N-acetyltransferase, partial [Dehalococcoidia bacterium]